LSLIIHAPNVHQGGGRTLLLTLLQAVRNFDCCAILDVRLQLTGSIPASLTELRVPPSLWGRLGAEWRLRRLAKAGDTILCFGNLPPVFSTHGKVVLFLQNRYLLGGMCVDAFPLRVRIRIAVERACLYWRLKTVNTIVVQTPTMQREVESALGKYARVLPFVSEVFGYSRIIKSVPVSQSPTYDFVYVASAEPHKNHCKLLEAWTLLAQDGLYPSLCLTVDGNTAPALYNRISQLSARHRLKIETVGALSAEGIFALYRHSKALIYPSTAESLGLPLIEARYAGLPILAAERDYVRDVLDPEQSFDPDSPISIARAVKRHLRVPERPLPLVDAKGFLRELGLELG
jgi:glycosyltransferase involved in cell wall biosynthesis